MEQISNSNVNNVSFQAHQTSKTPVVMQSAPQMQIENGDEKSMGALKWAGIIGAGALAVGGTIYAIKHPEKMKKLGNNIKSVFKKGKADASNVKKMSAKQAHEVSMQSVKDVSESAQSTITGLKKGVDDLKLQKAAYSKQEASVKAAQEKVDTLTKQLEEAKKAGKKTSKIEGHLGQAKGEYNKAAQALKRMKNPTQADIQSAGKAISEAAKKSPENAAVVQMQRMKRKHPEISDETAKKVFDTSVSAKTAKKAKPTTMTYDGYLQKVEKQGKDNFMSRETYMKAKQKKALMPEYQKYLTGLKDGEKAVPFSEFIKTV